jgi:hypothetical protein
VNDHEWHKVLEAEWVNSNESDPMITWKCRRCGSTVTERQGTLAEVFAKHTDCDEELVRDVMES